MKKIIKSEKSICLANNIVENEKWLEFKDFIRRLVIKIAVMVFMIVFIIGCNGTYIYANDFGTIYYYENYEEGISTVNVGFDGYETTEKIEYIIKYLLEINGGYVPEGTELLWVFYFEGNLFLNFNENLLNYSGSFYEECLLEQIFLSCFSIEEVERVSIFINEESLYFPEGHEVIGVEKSWCFE